MIDYCVGCWCEDTCDKLCDEAEEYTAQDHVHQSTHLVYVGSGAKLDYLANDSDLTLADMQTDVRLGIQEWHYVKQAKLTEQQMQTVWLYYWEKLTMKQIGVKLEISEPTVHKHIRYAKKKLIKMLKPE